MGDFAPTDLPSRDKRQFAVLFVCFRFDHVRKTEKEKPL